MSIDRIKYVIGETTEFTLTMQNVTRSGLLIITNIGAKLDHGEFLGSNALDQFILVESASEDVLARIKGIDSKWLPRAIAQK